MYKKFALLYCVMLCATEAFGSIWYHFIRSLLQAEDRNITRVRTVEELQARKNENVVLDFIGLVEQYKGYTAEEYDVQTDDGYILKLHRISGSPYSPAAPGKPILLLQHGIITSTDFFVLLGPKQALDAGYDVWLGNVRGNSYSKRHVNLTSASNNYDFWNFSMDEMGVIDVPKFIDTVLEKTKQKKLTYIGYSMGSTISCMLLSSKPEYNSKINLVVSVGPVVFFSPPNSDVENYIWNTFYPPFKRLAETMRSYEVFPQTKNWQAMIVDVCDFGLGKIFCHYAFSMVVKNMNFSAIPIIGQYWPAGSSLHTIIQFQQFSTTQEFKMYDFGRLDNKLKYGSFTPPKYNLSKITTPHAIYYGDNDSFVSVKDAKRLKNILKNVVIFQKAPTGYNHLDYFFSTDVRQVFYGQILDGIRRFTQ